VRKLFRRTVPIGIEYGTVGVLDRDGVMYEVTTFRRDVETSGRHAVVEFADTLDEDLARRDFTINAVAWHPIREELSDPFDGVADLDAGILRTVGDPSERFAEDYLRVIRGVRFAGRFDLSIDPDTWDALKDATPHLDVLSAERVRDEFLKMVSRSPRPSVPFRLMAEAGILGVLTPELVTSGKEWEAGLAAADRIPAHRPLVRMAALLSALEDPPEGLEVGASEAEAGDGRSEARLGVEAGWAKAEATGRLLDRLRFSNREIRSVGGLVEALYFTRPAPDDEVAVRRWVVGVGRDRLPDLIRLVSGFTPEEGREGFARLVRAARAVCRSGCPLAVGELAIDGRALIRAGVRPGPRFGRLLEVLLDEVVEEPSRNDPEYLVARGVELAGEWTDT
jgi:tRNA nucleotidyltransferase (CCA-adding enzyme)